MKNKVVVIEVDLRRLEMIQKNLKPRAHAVLDKAAFEIEGIAKTLAPVLTGALRASIYVTGSSGGSTYDEAVAEAQSKSSKGGKSVEFVDEMKAGEFERIIGPSVVYGIFPEVQGQPYLVPAVEQARGSFTKAWEALFD